MSEKISGRKAHFIREKFETKTAILVDGGFYRSRANALVGSKSPKERADELERYCLDHLHDKYEKRFLYRIFYYDCAPIEKGTNGKWMQDFLAELKHRRKFALRMGRLGTKGNSTMCYNLRPEITKELLNGKKALDDLSLTDFKLNVVQKGVDMRIGVDISSIAFKHQVDQIVLIAGDSDFVPAAKQARREGIDFILDPMGNHIPDDLFEHIDGVRTQKLVKLKEPLGDNSNPV